MPKSRAEINRQNYEKNKEKRQEAARERARQLRADWRNVLASWEASDGWRTETYGVAGLSQHAVEAATIRPCDRMVAAEEEDD